MASAMPYQKLAVQLLRDHASEEPFEVSFFTPHECDGVAAELEKLGCKVVKDQHSHCLTVTPPEKITNGSV